MICNGNSLANSHYGAGEFEACFQTPVCLLGIRTAGEAVIGMSFLPSKGEEKAPVNPVAEALCQQLERYLADPEFRFTVPILPSGTKHQLAVWTELCRIPAGKTAWYGALARQIGSGARAVGQACGANPIVLIIPCHRVVARDGIGGFSNQVSGFPMQIKSWLLKHEHAVW